MSRGRSTDGGRGGGGGRFFLGGGITLPFHHRETATPRHNGSLFLKLAFSIYFHRLSAAQHTRIICCCTTKPEKGPKIIILIIRPCSPETRDFPPESTVTDTRHFPPVLFYRSVFAKHVPLFPRHKTTEPQSLLHPPGNCAKRMA